MTEHGFALFDTDIGRCGIAWGARGIIGVQLPEAGEARTRARLVKDYRDVPLVGSRGPMPRLRATLLSIALRQS